eukprot:sb/3474456/
MSTDDSRDDSRGESTDDSRPVSSSKYLKSFLQYWRAFKYVQHYNSWCPPLGKLLYNLATTRLARAIIKGTWRSPCRLQLGTKGNSILHVHSFTFVLMSSSSTPSAIRQRSSRSKRTAAGREQATENYRLRQRFQVSQ